MRLSESPSWHLRVATLDDAADILTIYGPYVEFTNVSFETVVPTLASYKERMHAILERYPFLVAEDEAGVVVGYCYAGPFKARKAYDWSVEISVYTAPEAQGSGVAHALYDWLEDILRIMGVTNMNACIAHPNPASYKFHERRGFVKVAHFTQCGYKLSAWQDMIWMEKFLSEHPANPAEIVPFPALMGMDVCQVRSFTPRKSSERTTSER